MTVDLFIIVFGLKFYRNQFDFIIIYILLINIMTVLCEVHRD